MQCDPCLQVVMSASIANSHVDFGITCGHRNEYDQNKAFDEGKSKVRFPNGKHNKYPSEAVDVLAYVKGKPTYEITYYVYLYGLFSGIARSLGYDIRSGLDWDSDGEIMTDQTLQDGCHFEILL